jgi:hypothetical protein
MPHIPLKELNLIRFFAGSATLVPQNDEIEQKKGVTMRVSNISNIFLLGLALFVSTGGASAATKGSLKLNEPVTVSGTRLAKGEYKVTWEGNGPNVELNIIMSNSIVATVPARLIELSRPGKNQGYGTRVENDGMTSLTTIYFVGKKYELEIGAAAAPMEHAGEGGQN